MNKKPASYFLDDLENLSEFVHKNSLKIKVDKNGDKSIEIPQHLIDFTEVFFSKGSAN